MTDNEKQIIIAEAQNYVKCYNATPNAPMYSDVREMFCEKYETVAGLYYKLTGKSLVVDKTTNTVKEEV